MSLLFLISAGGAMVCSLLAVIWIIRSYASYPSAQLPYADVLARHYDSLLDHENEPGDGADPDELFRVTLRRYLITAATKNGAVNDRRAELMYRASVFLSTAVIFTLVAGIPVIYDALANVVSQE